ncbi:MAG TPA: cob(I)yrinic acid a,c-diamide adenosyltransferase [Cytophagaceae bacterium]|jgi:cob(I)alamin adenosyltransferase|nr:cob(I)yrinic acid a,c-diamide adenosyltransferase [Cytophagaceae bacterium]
MKIYTKSGDQGETSLYGGTRISKSDIRIESYGSVDELNAYIGLLGDLEVNKNRKPFLKEIQDRLFTIGALLAADPEKLKLKKPSLIESDVELIEKEIDLLQEHLPEMKSFILPGGHQHVSFCHLARTVCRRAERQVVLLAENDVVELISIMYLNRLSDYLFVLSRKMAMELGAEETPWKPRY